MQCSCGGEAVTTSSKRGAANAEFRYSECRACKRVSDGAIFVRGIEVMSEDGSGSMAVRNTFQSIDILTAEQLYEKALSEIGSGESGASDTAEQGAFDF